MRASLNPRTCGAKALVHRAGGLLLAAGLLAAAVGCAGERPSLGAVPPSTTTSTTTAPAAPPERDTTLGPDDLQGWIATPTGTPEVFRSPSASAEAIEIAPTTAAGAPTTFAIVGDGSPQAAPVAPGWYEVALPTRPNGSTGWVRASSVQVARTPFRIFVDLDARTLTVEEDQTSVFTADIAIGTDENPTPVNGTFVTELIESTEPDGAYGPFAFGLAMHSDTLTEFNGGPGQVGIHGTNRPELIGQPVSAGCVRLANTDIEALVDLALPLGVPVFMT